MKANIKSELQQIYRAFEDKTTHQLDLKKLRLYLQEGPKNQQCIIFKKQMEQFQSVNFIEKDKFMKHFDQSITNKDYFDIVFGSIDSDGSKMISKSQLQILIKEHGLNYSKEDIALMMEMASQDGEKISQAELKKFLQIS